MKRSPTFPRLLGLAFLGGSLILLPSPIHAGLVGPKGGIRAARFLQMEYQLALLIDLNIAAGMLAVGTTPPTQK